MSSSKIAIALAFVVLACSCQMPKYVFNSNDIVTEDIRQNTVALLKAKAVDSIIDIRAYKAELVERPVNNNAVADFRLMNTLSKKNTLDYFSSRYKNVLYYYEFRSKRKTTYGLLFSATFYGEDTCIGIGPMYVGNVGPQPAGHRVFTAMKEYYFKRTKTGVGKMKSTNKAPQLRFSFTSSDESVPFYLNFFRIIHDGKNKVSGMNKPVVYDIPAIFNDSSALKFELTPNL